MASRSKVFGCLFSINAMCLSFASAQPLTLEEAVSLAHQSDFWLKKSQYQEEAQLAQSSVAGSLPDPRISLGVANLPTDSFDFDQESMTQFKVGVSQMFPRGSTRTMKRRQLQEQSSQHPHMRKNRMAETQVQVSTLWLEIFRNQESIRLVEKDRALFEHLAEVAESSYRSGMGNTQQQDLIRSQLELTRLEDRLTVLHQKQNVNLAHLKEWLSKDSLDDDHISTTLPTIELHQILRGSPHKREVIEKAIPFFFEHPKVKALDQKVLATHVGVELAEQKYKPQWGINASYGYRDDDPSGNRRSDFFSFGISMDIPLYASSKQDQEVQAALAKSSSVKTDRSLLLRAMRSQFEAAYSRFTHLSKRKALYENQLLKEAHNQAEASLTAYTHDAGDFSEVVRARIAELNTSIDFLNIQIDQLITIAQLNYFLPPSDNNQTGSF